MDIFLTRELETWMRDCLRAGRFRSEGELVRHALRRLREQDPALPAGEAVDARAARRHRR